MNAWFDEVERLTRRDQRLAALRALTGGELGARKSRGRALGAEVIDALIWGLAHASPVVRRCCLELLDLHPDPRATAAIEACLDDPVPRVRWHAVHTLSCDACKGGGCGYIDPRLRERISAIAASDPSPRVRAQATLALA